MTSDTAGTAQRGRFLFWLLPILVLGAAAAWFMFSKQPQGKTDGKAEVTAEVGKDSENAKPTGPFELAASDVATVQQRGLVRKLPLSGTLRPLVQTTVKSKVAGELLEVSVREGQAVTRGQVLARIDTRNQQAIVASQRAGLEKARADSALAKLNFENNQRLLEKHYIAQNVLDTSKSVYQASQANEKLALAQLQLAEIGLADAVVKSPIDGIVARRAVEPGEKVSPDSTLLQLVDLSNMELQAAVPAAEVPFVKAGQIAQVTVDGYQGLQFDGRVERINPTSEQGSRSIMLYLSIPNEDGRLRGGMFAQGNLVIAEQQQGLAVPSSAIRSDAGIQFALAIESGKLVRKPVTLGLQTEDASFVEVREGLSEGAQVLVGRLDALEPGSEVVLNAAALPAVEQAQAAAK